MDIRDEKTGLRGRTEGVGFPSSVTAAVTLMHSPSGDPGMMAQNLREMTETVRGPYSMGDRRVQVEQARLSEPGPHQRRDHVPHSRSFLSLGRLYSMPCNNIRLIPGPGSTSRAISRAGDADGPIGVRPVRNRGTAPAPNVSGQAVSADFIEENIRLFTRLLHVMGLMGSKPDARFASRPKSAVQTSVHKTIHRTLSGDRNHKGAFAGRPGGPIGPEPQGVSGEPDSGFLRTAAIRHWFGEAQDNAHYLRIPQTPLENSLEGTVRMAGAAEK